MNEQGFHLDNIVARFWSSADRQPAKTFCIFVDGVDQYEITNGDMASMVGTYTAHYRRSGVENGDVVLIFLNHSVDVYACFLAAMSIGAIPSLMPIPNSKQDARLYWTAHSELLDRVGSAWILAGDELIAQMDDAGLRVAGRALKFLDVRTGDRVTEADAMTSILDNSVVALLQHSSGTTGLKKGVALTYENVENQLNSYSAFLGIRPDDRIVSWLPLYHDMGLVACFLLPIHNGLPFIHVDSFYWLLRPGMLFELAQQHRGTLIWMPNFAFDHLVRTVSASAADRFDLSCVRQIINCSEMCRPATVARFHDKFRQIMPGVVQSCYAMAETVFAVAQSRYADRPSPLAIDATRTSYLDEIRLVESEADGRTMIDCGRPISGITVEIHDPAGSPLPEHVVGDIVVSGGFVFEGYFKNDELTMARRRNDWYYTQDVGFMHNGDLFVLGRKDDVIICNGKNLYAPEIEAVVNLIQGVKPGRAVAVGFDDSKAGTQKLVVIAERQDAYGGPDIDLQRTISSVVLTACGLAPHAVKIVSEGWLVKTTSGKISRSENIKKYSGS